jgi:hypothetical protein
MPVAYSVAAYIPHAWQANYIWKSSHNDPQIIKYFYGDKAFKKFFYI